MTVRPPDTLNSGTYWTRMVTSSVPTAPPVDTVSQGISAKIRFVLNQVTTVIYRIDSATTGLDITNMRNRLIHAYFDINLDILWETVNVDIPGLIEKLEKIFPSDEI